MAVLYFPGCPNCRMAGQRMRQGLDAVRHPDMAVTFGSVQPATTGAGFAGSPNLHVDGVAVFPTRIQPGGLSCRLYATAGPIADRVRFGNPVG